MPINTTDQVRDCALGDVDGDQDLVIACVGSRLVGEPNLV